MAGTVYGVNGNLLATFGFVLAMVLLAASPPAFVLFGTVVLLAAYFATIVGTESGEAHARSADPLGVLQTRYARGEIDEAEFERRLDRILSADEAVRKADPDRLDEREPVHESA